MNTLGALVRPMGSDFHSKLPKGVTIAVFSFVVPGTYIAIVPIATFVINTIMLDSEIMCDFMRHGLKLVITAHVMME